MSRSAPDQGFLGEEFLTWLWFRQETRGGEFELAGGRVIGVALDDLLTFTGPAEDETEQILRHGLPTRTAEARTALRQGRRLRRARLVLAEGGRQWQATLDGTTLAMSGVKLPPDAEDVADEAERAADRAASWLALHDVVLALYGEFLGRRLRPEYPKRDGLDQARWMAGGPVAPA